MIYGLTYADHKMTTSAQVCKDSMMRQGFEHVYTAAPEHIDAPFMKFNADILRSERGCGFWLWKPYFINRVMMDLKDGDILAYSDAGVEWVAPVSHILDRMDEDVFLFTNGHKHVEWCKGDVLNGVLGWDQDYGSQHYFHALRFLTQVQASVIIIKVTPRTRNFVKEWLLYCQMPGFIDDSPSVIQNYPTFADHRHDQAILTCMQIKYGYKTHWWPTQYSEHIRVAGDDYPVIFNHHRKRDKGFGGGDAEW
jgi:hypothetical protein